MIIPMWVWQVTCRVHKGLGMENHEFWLEWQPTAQVMPSRFIIAFRTSSILLVDMCHRQKPVPARNSHTNLLAIAQTLPKHSLSIHRSLYPLPCLCNMPISPQSHGFDAPHQIQLLRASQIEGGHRPALSFFGVPFFGCHAFSWIIALTHL
jgi:hypothetical protein